MSNFASIRMGAFSKRTLHLKTLFSLIIFKGTVMQIEKALINDCLRVSEVSKKIRIPTICGFVVIYP